MAVQTIQNNNSSPFGNLGTLGTLAMFGGTLTGQPWLTALGTGMSAAGKMLGGQGNMNDQKQNADAFQEAIKGLWGWVNPASGNIAKSASTIKDIADSVGNPSGNSSFWGGIR